MNDIPDELHVIARDASDFLRAFRLVFHEDWTHTKSMLQGFDHSTEGNATFINLGVGNTYHDPDGYTPESANWSNRGGLLDAYRQLSETLTRFGAHPDQLEPAD